MITADETLLRIARAVAGDVEIDRVDPSDYEHLAEVVEAMAAPSCASLAARMTEGVIGSLQAEIERLRSANRDLRTDVSMLRDSWFRDP